MIINSLCIYIARRKNERQWKQLFKENHNVSPETEAAWWNLGIAATVLKDWHKAREAWSKFGLDLELTNEEPRLNLSNAPIRLNPNENAEVVWCKRIDPARALILNVPLASSGHRFGDLVLNDGAPVGYRISQGVEYPVFNELQLLEKSAYKTYSVTTYVNGQSDIDKLKELCKDVEVELEDWSTVRTLCRKCSEGIPHEDHDQDLNEQENRERHLGFAALTREPIIKILADWRAITLCDHTEPSLEIE